MYQIGALLFYGETGVCRVADIQVRSPGRGEPERSYYVLEPLYQSCTITTPVDSDKVFMRPILTREEADALIDRIPRIKAQGFYSRALRELTGHYQAALKTHDCQAYLELTMSIYAKKQFAESRKRKFGQVDARFMKRAENLLYGEFSVALGIPFDDVQAYIAERVSKKV